MVNKGIILVLFIHGESNDAQNFHYVESKMIRSVRRLPAILKCIRRLGTSYGNRVTIADAITFATGLVTALVIDSRKHYGVHQSEFISESQA